MADPQPDVESGQAGRVRGPPLGVGQGRVDHSAGLPFLTVVGFAFLTFNSGMAIYRSNGDPEAIAFVSFSYVDLVMLFYCLQPFKREAPSPPSRGWLKACVWALTTLLTVMFSYKVASIMPFPVAVLVWGMAISTVLGGFYAFFIPQDKGPQP